MEEMTKRMIKLMLALLMILSIFNMNDVNATSDESLLEQYPNTVEVL